MMPCYPVASEVASTPTSAHTTNIQKAQVQQICIARQEGFYTGTSQCMSFYPSDNLPCPFSVIESVHLLEHHQLLTFSIRKLKHVFTL